MRLSLIIIATTIFSISNSYGQDTKLTKRNILEIFKHNARGTLFDWNKREWDDGTNSSHFSKYNSWVTCNDDSVYNKLDTIEIYNYNTYYSKLNCEWFKRWIFHSKNKVDISDSRPPLGVTGQIHTINVLNKKSKLYIEITENQNLIESFIVHRLELISLESGDKVYKLTLVRNRCGKSIN